MNLKINQRQLQILPIQIPIYNWTIVILVGTQDDAESYISSIEEVRMPAQEYGIQDAACYQYSSTIYVWIQSNVSISILCHEVAHATFYLMETVHLDITDQEAFCYLFEYILNECLKVDELYIQMVPSDQVSTLEDTPQSSVTKESV